MNNPEQIVPFPYYFPQAAPSIPLEAPIIIVGDQMGENFARFKDELAATISVNVDRPIKIQNLAKKGHGLHRTLHELKSLAQWPQILIYQGGSEEFKELKFRAQEVTLIKRNFKRYQDERIETALILYPWISRLVYEPVNRVPLAEAPKLLPEIDEQSYLSRLETELLLFEQQLIQLVNLSKDRNSLLILTTTPLNLDTPPKKVCEFTSQIDLEKAIYDLKELIKTNNPKTAYAKSRLLVKQYAGNAELFYLHGQIAKRLGFVEEATNSLLEATAFDCNPWRSSEVYNSIIRKVAKDHQVILFDFSRFLNDEWSKNLTFFDEYYPQNLYYDKGMQQLGQVIKEILKL